MAGTATVSRSKSIVGAERPTYLEVITVAWTADASTGSVPDTTVPNVRGTLERIVTVPGATQPTSLYDITLVDADAIDVLGGAGSNRSASAAEEAAVAVGTYFQRTVAGDLTFKLANNSVNSATGTFRLYVKR